MKKFLTGLLSITIMASLALTGCSSSNTESNTTLPAPQAEEKKASVVWMNLQAEPPSLHPGIATDVQSLVVIRATMEGLMRIGQDGKPHEAGTEKIEVSQDLKTYTFTLRDHKWSNGEPVTAQDYEYAWKWILDPKNEAPYSYMFYPIVNAEKAKKGEVGFDQVGFKIIDEKTFQVQLINPTPYFLELAAFTVFYPVNKKAAESNPNWYAEAATHIGNGPYKLAVWNHGSELELKKNDSYWDVASMKGDTVKLAIIEDQNTELSMFESGELDWAGAPLSEIPPDALVALLKEKKVISQPIAGTHIYRFNTTKEPFTNTKIRKAFAYAIDRQSIMENVAQGGQMPAMAFVPPTMVPENQQGLFPDHQVDEAKKLLAEGMKELGIAQLPPVELLYNTTELNSKIAQAIQDQWKQNLGVDVTLVNKERKVQLEEEKAGQYMISRGNWIGDFNDPVNFLEVFLNADGNNRTYWHNEEYSRLITDTYSMSDHAKRLENFGKAEKILMDEMPFMPIYFSTANYIKQDNLKGVYMDGLGSLDLKWAYVE